MKTLGNTVLFLAMTLASMSADFMTAVAQEPLNSGQNQSAVDINELRKLLTDSFQQYESALQAVLKTRYPEEKQYVTSVVYLIQTEKLPKHVVDSAWAWVRKNRPTTRYPFVYFERVLYLEAEKLKLKVPEFDRELYTRSQLTQGFQSGFRR